MNVGARLAERKLIINSKPTHSTQTTPTMATFDQFISTMTLPAMKRTTTEAKMELDSHSDWNVAIAKETAILKERGAWGTPLKEGWQMGWGTSDASRSRGSQYGNPGRKFYNQHFSM